MVLAEAAWCQAFDVTTLTAKVADRVAENLARHGLDVVVGAARATRDYLDTRPEKRPFMRTTARIIDDRCDAEAEAQKGRASANGSGRDRFGHYTGATAKARATRFSPICDDDAVWAAAAAITNREDR